MVRLIRRRDNTVINTFPNETALMRFAQKRGWLRPAGEDEGGPNYGVLRDDFGIDIGV